MPCGARGCLEQYASGTALEDSSVAEIGSWLGRGLAQVVAVLDPALVLVGGGVAAATGDELLAPARAALQASLPLADVRPAPPLAVARLGDLAGVVGAAAHAAEQRTPCATLAGAR